MNCSHCQEPLVPQAKFCPNCGTPVAARPVPSTPEFTAYIAERSRGFVGREWVFEKIDAWIGDPASPRYFVLSGAPGVGKTALAARLVQLGRAAGWHFCIAHNDDAIDPRKFALSLAGQLSRIEGFPAALLQMGGVSIEAQQSVQQNIGTAVNVLIERLVIQAPSPATAFGQCVTTPLQQLYQSGFDQRLMLVVDALDEALRLTREENILELLMNAGGLPPEVRILLTTRPESDVLRHFFSRDVPHLQVDAGAEENYRDARCYLLGHLRASAPLKARLASAQVPRGHFARRALQASGGNFLYLRMLVEAVEQDRQSLDGLERLPEGLNGIYHDALLARAGRDYARWQELFAPVLGVLAVARAPLDLETLAAICGQQESSLRVTLRGARQFLAPRDYEQGHYHFFHKSFIDFLQQPDHDFYLDPADYHRAIAQASLGEAKTWADVDWARAPDYILQHLAEHLYLAGERQQDWQGLFDLISWKFIAEKERRAWSPDSRWVGGLRSALLDVEYALQAALQAGYASRVTGLLLVSAHLQQGMGAREVNGGIALDAAARRYQRAVARAEAIEDINVRFELYLLVACLALENEDLEQALGALDKALELKLETSSLHAQPLVSCAQKLLASGEVRRAKFLAQKTSLDWSGVVSGAVTWLTGATAAHDARLLEQALEGVGPSELKGILEPLCTQHPETARALLKSLIEKAEQGEEYPALVRAAALLRRVDQPTAERSIRQAIAALRGALEGPLEPPWLERELQEALNMAVLEFAHADLAEALELAISVCPDVDDSSQTRSNTLAEILYLAAESGRPVAGERLQIIQDLRSGWPDQTHYTITSHLGPMLALNYALAGQPETALQLLDTATLTMSSLWVLLRLSREGILPETVLDAEASSLEKAYILGEQEITQFATELVGRPEWVALGLDLLGIAREQYDLLRELLAMSPPPDPALAAVCARFLGQEGDEGVRRWQTLQLLPGLNSHDSDLARELLEDISAAWLADPDLPHDTAPLVQVALDLGQAELARQVLGRWLQASLDRGWGGEVTLEELALWAPRCDLEIWPEQWGRLFANSQDTFVKGWLAARRLGGVPPGVEGAGLSLKPLQGVLGSWAQKIGSRRGLDLLATWTPDPLDQGLRDIQSALILAENNPRHSQQLLEELWKQVDAGAFSEGDASQLVPSLVAAQGVLAPESALERLGGYSLEERYGASRGAVDLLQDQPEAARLFLAEMEAILKEVSSSQEFDLQELIDEYYRVGQLARAVWPDLAARLAEEMLRQAGALALKEDDAYGYALNLLHVLGLAPAISADQTERAMRALRRLVEERVGLNWLSDTFFDLARYWPDRAQSGRIWELLRDGAAGRLRPLNLGGDLAALSAHLGGEAKRTAAGSRRRRSSPPRPREYAGIAKYISAHAHNDQDGAAQMLDGLVAWLTRRLHARRSSERPIRRAFPENWAQTEAEIGQFLFLLTQYYPAGLLTQEQLQAVEGLVRGIQEVANQDSAMLWLVPLALKAALPPAVRLRFALRVADRLIHMRHRKLAAEAIAVELIDQWRDLALEEQREIWSELFKVARGNVEARLFLAQVWSGLALEAGPEAQREELLLDLIGQLEYADSVSPSTYKTNTDRVGPSGSWA